MSFKSDIINYYKTNVPGQNYFVLPDEVFRSLAMPKNRILVEPITFDKEVEIDGAHLVFDNLPYIRGKIVKSCTLDYYKGQTVIYNSNILSFIFYESRDTGDLLISLNTNDLILGSHNA